MQRITLIFVALALVAPLAAGCGPTRPKTIRVGGRITFAGGPPPAAGSLAFAPLEPAEGFPLRGGIGSFDTAGNIRVTSFADGDGLVPGRYEVKVECWRSPPNENSPGESFVPAGFKAPELDVPASTRGTLEVALDVPAK